MLHPIGTRVQGVHGVGTIIAHNVQPELNEYIQNNAEFLNTAAELGLLSTNNFYPASRYPYLIQFDEATMPTLVEQGRAIGFTEVYGPNDFTLIE